ncbi:MAG: two-component regulator propeller domain-containing protein [Saprospiraceae bacterium]
MFIQLFRLRKLLSLRSPLTLYLLLSVLSCGINTEGEEHPNPDLNNQVLRRPLDVSGAYVFNPVTGDSIELVLDQNGMPFETMKLTPAKGRIDKLFQQPKKVLPAQWEKLEKDLKTNIRPTHVNRIQKLLKYDTLAVIKDDTYVLKSTIGDTIPSGIPVKIEGKKIPAKYPNPVTSLSPVLHYDEGVNLKQLGVDQGLIMETTTGIVEDKYGNKWVSYLGGGLSKFDGQSFWHFTEKEGLPNTLLWGILEASDGRLWLNSLNEGVIVFDGEHFINYSAKEGLPGHGIRDIFEDSRGNIWLKRKFGVSKYDGETFTHFTTKEGLVDNTIIRIYEDKEGMIWLVGFGKLSRYDGTSFSNFSIRHPNGKGYINPLFEDHAGNLWLSSEDEIFRYDGTSFTSFPANLREARLSWEEDTTSGHIWISFYSDHIYKFDGEDFWEYAIIDEIKSSSIEKIEKDESGNIWFSTTGAGLYVLNENSFNSISGFDGQVRKGRGNKLWINIPPGALNKLEDGIFWRLRGSDQQDNIGPVLEDSRQNIWMGQHQGLSKFDGQNITFYRDEASPYMFMPRDIKEDHLGNIWLTWNNGVIVKYDGIQFIQYGEQDGLPGYGFSYIIEDQQHNLWFSSEGGGLMKFDGEAFSVFSEKEGLSSNHIISMAEDKAGNIWLGTEGKGLMKFDGTCFTYYTEDHGLSNNVVSSITIDPQNRVWIGTNNGLNVFIPKNEEQAPVTGEALEERYIQNDYAIYSFYKKDGLINNELGWNAMTVDEDNVLWGTLFGKLFKLDLNHFALPQAPISVRLDHLDLNGRSIDFRETKENRPTELKYTAVPPFFNYPANPTFSYNKNHLTFHYSATDWAAPHKIRYSYRIADSNEAWSVPSSEAKADFRNLSPGSHTFEVRAMGQSQKWGEPFVYNFRILPPWWRTWWAYTCYLLAIAAIIRAVYRFQLRRQFEKQETENLKRLDVFKNRLYTNITHEFRTPLMIISGIIDQIIETPELWLKRGAKMIKYNSAGLLDLVNQIMDLRKLESNEIKVKMANGNVVKYLRYISESHQSYAEHRGLQLHFLTAEEQIQMDYDPDKLLRIISNLLSNAIKFTPEGGNIYFHIDKKMVEGKSTLSLRVQDTGVGIPEEDLPYVFGRFYQTDHSAALKNVGTGIGLSLVKELVKVLNGDISVKSTVGKGSTFTVELPIANESLLPAEDPNGIPTMSEMEGSILSSALLHPDAKESNQAFGTNEKPNLLIVEDNPDVRQYLIACLENDYQLTTAENGRIGIEMAIEAVPDLIVSDVMMPEKDGYELTETLKNDERTDHIPIILLTAKADLDSRISGLEKGADAYLAKPFEKRELLIRLEKLLELRRKLQVRYAKVTDSAEDAETLSVPEHPFLQKFYGLVEKEISNPDLDMNQLCRALGMSRSQVFRN